MRYLRNIRALYAKGRLIMNINQNESPAGTVIHRKGVAVNGVQFPTVADAIEVFEDRVSMMLGDASVVFADEAFEVYSFGKTLGVVQYIGDAEAVFHSNAHRDTIPALAHAAWTATGKQRFADLMQSLTSALARHA